MPGKWFGGWAALVLAVGLFVPAASRGDAPCDCPGSSYAPCHYNFPILWNLCAHLRFHWHAPPEAPPPYSDSFYEYHSHCPYVEPATQLGFPSFHLRSKLAPSNSASP